MREHEVIREELIGEAFDLIYLTAAYGAPDSVKYHSEDLFVDEAYERIPWLLKKRLISISGIIRNTIFENEPINAAGEDWDQFTKRRVGTIEIDGSKSEELYFKSACDKLIHSRCIYFSDLGDPQHDANFDVARVEGVAQNKKGWVANINIPLFAAAVYLSVDEWCKMELEP